VPRYDCFFTLTPPTIDAEIDEAWNRTRWSSVFDQPDVAAVSSPDVLAFKALFDREHLYLLVRGTFPVQEDVFYIKGDLHHPFAVKENAEIYEALSILWDPRGEAPLGAPFSQDGFFLLTTSLHHGQRDAGEPGPPYISSAMTYQPHRGINQPRLRPWYPRQVQVAIRQHTEGILAEIAIPFRQMNELTGRALGEPRPGEPRLDISEAPQPGSIWAFQIIRTHPNQVRWAWRGRLKEGGVISSREPDSRPWGQLTFKIPRDLMRDEQTAAAMEKHIDTSGRFVKKDWEPLYFETDWKAAIAQARSKRQPLVVLYAAPGFMQMDRMKEYWETPNMKDAADVAVFVRVDPATMDRSVPLPPGGKALAMVILTPEGRRLRAWSLVPKPAAFLSTLEQITGHSIITPSE
jgi:hypothetical protein